MSQLGESSDVVIPLANAFNRLQSARFLTESAGNVQKFLP